MVNVLLNVMGPVVLIGLLGFFWARSGRPFDANGIGSLVTNVACPCLNLDILSSLTVSPGDLWDVFIAAALCHIGFAIVGFAVTRSMKLPLSTYLPGVIFANTGNIGLPLCLFAFGQQGLGLALGYSVLSSVALFTLAPQIAAGRASFSELIKSPLVWSVAAGLIVFLSGYSLPQWVSRPVHLLGGMTFPLMLLALGVSLARLRVSSLRYASILAVARVGGGLLVGILVSWVLGLHGLMRGAVIVEAVMPVAVFNYLFAVRYHNGPEEVAGMVLMSTALSFLVLPFVLHAVMVS